ncbi:antiterminator LoaP [Biomaibacter acetigenes]|uniref:Transcription termination/antitermination protein NusG n=1 Tax=Biomaibacter acetigenes TaxID=2316383 RepID=A0A3G2R7K6_9FIRM|nr:antiterminator LoaP [Biomaibacter acetigenes]AYO31452.1 antiterminator LoaP [Biomaibacter acetigenes]
MRKKWYVLFTKTGEEKKLKEAIEHIFPPDEVKPLIPRRRLMEKRQGKKIEVVRTLFPGYVFINTVMTEETYRSIKLMPVSAKLLMTDLEPAEVPPEEMKPILRLTSVSDVIGFSTGIRVGTKVKIIEGPLKDFEGIIIDVDSRKGRAKVMLDILNETKKVDLGLTVIKDIEKSKSI